MANDQTENIYNTTFPFTTEGERNALEHALMTAIHKMHPTTNKRTTLCVKTESGETTYGMEYVEVLDELVLAVGMIGNGQVKIFDIMDGEDAVQWLMDDIQLLGDSISVLIVE